jgi:hypothetical protein
MSMCEASASRSGGEVEESTHIIPSLSPNSLDDDIHDVDTKVEVGLLLDESAERVKSGSGERRILCGNERELVQLKAPLKGEATERTRNFVLADFQELLVGRDETVFPFSLTSDDLTDFGFLLGFSESTDSIPATESRGRESVLRSRGR